HAGSAEEEIVVALLSRRMDDADARVARQAAFFLRLLKDKRVDAKASALLGISFNTPTNTPIANALTTGIIELPETFRNFDWQTEAARGDTKKGQELFTTRGCAVCHEIKSGDKGGRGPSLAGAGSRFNVAYLVEPLTTPNNTGAPMSRWRPLRSNDAYSV